MPGKGFALNGYEDYNNDREKKERLRERMERQTQEHEQQDPEIYCVDFIPVKCPSCGSKKSIKYKHLPPARYHKCLDCGFRFKSIEK